MSEKISSLLAFFGSVPKPAGLVDIERRLGELRAEADEVAASVSALDNGCSDSEVERELVALQVRREDLEGKIGDASRLRGELLEPYLKAVARCMAPLARVAAERIVAAVAEVNAATELVVQIVGAGQLDMGQRRVFLGNLVGLHVRRENLESRIRDARRRCGELLDEPDAPPVRVAAERLVAAAAEFGLAIEGVAQIADACQLGVIERMIFLGEIDEYARRLGAANSVVTPDPPGAAVLADGAQHALPPIHADEF